MYKNRSDTINKKEKKNLAKSDISESPSGGIFFVRSQNG